MKHKIVSVLVAVSLVLSLLPSPAHADVGEAPRPGGLIVGGDQTDEIEMSSERVLFDIQESEGGCPFWDITQQECWYADVTATFNMRNLSTEDVTMDLMFPYPTLFSDPGEYTEYDAQMTRNFVVSIDGTEIEYTKAGYDYNYNGTVERILSVDFPVTFAAGATTEITVEYDTRLVHEPHSIYGSFLYIMESGSHWAGSIGSGEIIFQFPVDINEGLFSEYSRGFEMLNNKLVWNFRDLEPTREDNIKVTFATSLFDEMAALPDHIDGVISNNEVGPRVGPVLQIIPEGYSDYSFVGWSYNNSVYYLQKEELPTEGEEWVVYNWFTEMTEITETWIKYQFDGVYTIESISIFPGTRINLARTGSDETTDFYDLLNRPSQMRLRFSDGSTQTIDIPDTPDELVEIDITPVNTSFIRFEILSTYSDQMNTDKYVGISRLYANVGGKVSDLPVESNSSSSSEDASDQSFVDIVLSNPTYLAVAGLGGFALILSLVAIVVKIIKKSPTQTAQPEKK